MTVTAKQVQLIHIAKQKLSIADEDYRSILSELFNVTTSKQLTKLQADKLITHLVGKGFKIPARKAAPKGKKIVALPTSFQFELIDILKSNIVWKAGENGFQLWLEKRMRLKKSVQNKMQQKSLKV
ncbi:MAG: phage protein GemA/Gp16 family protein [Deferribacterales bacterium]